MRIASMHILHVGFATAHLDGIAARVVTAVRKLLLRHQLCFCMLLVACIPPGCTPPQANRIPSTPAMTTTVPTESGSGLLGSNLLFSTIEKGDFIRYQEEQPAMIIVASRQDVDSLAQTILIESPSAVDELHKLDYTQTFAILVLQGRKGTSGYGIAVQQLRRQDNLVIVDASVSNPAPGELTQQTFTSPYCLISVPKKGVWGQKIQFSLEIDSKPTANTTHTIP